MSRSQKYVQRRTVSPGNGRTSYTVDQKPLDIEAALDELFCNVNLHFFASYASHVSYRPLARLSCVSALLSSLASSPRVSCCCAHAQLAGSKNHEGWVPMYAFKNLLLGSSCPVTPVSPQARLIAIRTRQLKLTTPYNASQDDGFMSRIDMDEDGQVSYDGARPFQCCHKHNISDAHCHMLIGWMCRHRVQERDVRAM